MKTIQFNSKKNLNNYLKNIPQHLTIKIHVVNTGSYILEIL